MPPRSLQCKKSRFVLAIAHSEHCIHCNFSVMHPKSVVISWPEALFGLEAHFICYTFCLEFMVQNATLASLAKGLEYFGIDLPL